MNKAVFYKKSVLMIFCFCSVFVLAQDLRITKEDIRLETAEEGGYHLFIRQKEGVASVLLTETIKTLDGVANNYAYRAMEWNEINGDERRMLDGEFLDSPSSRYSLIDSSPEIDGEFGFAFHIYIPEVMEYGYPWSRNGVVEIQKGTFISIRTFTKPYADYEGADFLDNPFMFNFIAKKIERELEPEEIIPEPEEKIILTDDYNPVAVAAFEEIAALNKGFFTYSQGPESLADDVLESLGRIHNKERVDIVFAIDTTGSMKDDIEAIQKKLVPQLAQAFQTFGSVRYGLILYRDYVDNYRYKNLPVKFYNFTDNINEFLDEIMDITIVGNPGGDIPEAVWEALYASIEFYFWDAKAERKIILIGDAPPHPTPRGYTIRATKDMIEKLAKEKDIAIDAIILPDDNK